MAVTRAPLGGVLTALVTPFRDDALDEAALASLVERQIAAGIAGLVVASGVAGEAPTLTFDEVRRVIELCVVTAHGRIPVIAGASSNSTTAAKALVRQARDLGADAAMVTAPWYNRPGQEGAFRHYQAIAEAVDFPVLVDNAGARTMNDLSSATLRRLSALPSIIGIVDSSGDPARTDSTLRDCPDWTVLSGHDPDALGQIAQGVHGCVSLTANVAPKAMVALFDAIDHDMAGARRVQASLLALQVALAADPAPAATKFALAQLGLCQLDVRLPITPYAESLPQGLIEAMRALIDDGRPGAPGPLSGLM